MSEIFDIRTPVEGLTPVKGLQVCARHRKPSTDELVFAISTSWNEPNTIVLSRPRVRELHAALGKWLDEGWPGVAPSEIRLAGAA